LTAIIFSLLHFLNRSIDPKAPRAYRAVAALLVSFADGESAVIARAFLRADACSTRLIVRPGARRASAHKAWYALQLQQTDTFVND
jgi:hypothetical protein